MFHKIENRLTILIAIVLLAFAGTIIYLKVNEHKLILLISEESNSALKISITNNLQSSLNSETEIIDDEVIRQISKATNSEITIINTEEKESVLKYISDKPFVSYALIELKDKNETTKKYLFAKKESIAIKQKYDSIKKEYSTLVLIFLLFALTITAALFVQIVRPISTIIGSFVSN
ncbi:MAG: hypothetical protein EHM44_00690, partial [Ignavibacteriales bacterium]